MSHPPIDKSNLKNFMQKRQASGGKQQIKVKNEIQQYLDIITAYTTLKCCSDTKKNSISIHFQFLMQDIRNEMFTRLSSENFRQQIFLT